MANLNGIEKLKLEKLFDMGSGYVIDFSNRTIQEFVLESVNRDIYDSKYDYESGSKANRLRSFWVKESSPLVGKLIADLLEYWKTVKMMTASEITSSEQALYDECVKIAKRLKRENIVENIDVIHVNSDDRNFEMLAKSIRESIEKNEPEIAIDRLHTFVMRYVRELCDKYLINYTKGTPLHSLFGGYVKYLKENDIIESEMAVRILKSSISVLEAFNDIRNNKSLAHDNPVLNYDESILIFNDITNVIQFIESIETKEQTKEKNLTKMLD